MKHNKSEKGQALVLITFAIIGMIGLTALAVDGGMAYADRRHAQNAADSAAYAAALNHARNPTSDLTAAAKSIAAQNGYNDNGTSNTVSVRSAQVTDPTGCPALTNPADNLDITVTIKSNVGTTFANIIGIKQMKNTVTSTTRVCGFYVPPMFGGNAIVSLNDSTSDCGFDSNTGSATWKVTGGGLFSNGCVSSKGNVELDSGQCAGAIGTVTGFGTDACTGTQTSYDNKYVNGIMPPNPCEAGGVGLPQPAVVKGTGGVKDSVSLNNGVYCITDFELYDSAEIKLTNATLYVTNDNPFNLNFSGGGGFSGTPTQGGTYDNYFLIIEPFSTKCTSFTSNTTQAVNYRGGSGGDIPLGTVLAPTACIDLRGNGSATVNGQIIGYNVSANGNAGATINYVDTQNHKEPINPAIKLLK